MKLLPVVIIGIILGIMVYPKTPHLYVASRVIIEPRFTPTPTPTPSDKEVIDEVVRVFSPEGRHVVIKALNCFYSESGLRWNAIGINKNGTKDGGVAQINDVHGMTIEQRLDYKANIQKAYELYKRQGWNPWYGVGCH